LSVRQKTVTAKGTAAAKDAPQEKTKAGEVFKRFSAYQNDNRLKPDGGWRDGTYATTEQDASNVSTRKQAVERYALPNKTPASYRSHVGPTETRFYNVASWTRRLVSPAVASKSSSRMARRPEQWQRRPIRSRINKQCESNWIDAGRNCSLNSPNQGWATSVSTSAWLMGEY
jgi:hypothetical protein